MRKNIIKLISLFLVFMLVLSGCGENNGKNEPGSDWRVTGLYIWGTLEHGEKVNILAGMTKDKLTFYFDAMSKEVYTEVSFPYETTDFDKTFNSLSVKDINADGYSDCSVFLYNVQGEEEEVVFLWDAGKKEFVKD